MLTEKESEWLLDALCVQLGFCLDPMLRDDLMSNPPSTADGFAEFVFKSEGRSADTVEPALYASVQQLAARAYARAQERRV